MAAAKKTSANRAGRKKPHPPKPMLLPFVIKITSSGGGPTVDHPVAVVPDSQQIQWIADASFKFWVVKVEQNSSVSDGHGGYAFSPANNTTAPIKYNGPNIIKYSVATDTGVLDPHIIPMP
jgi:hypothetical protein